MPIISGWGRPPPYFMRKNLQIFEKIGGGGGVSLLDNFSSVTYVRFWVKEQNGLGTRKYNSFS